MLTLIIDNYDSFTFNLYQYLGELKANPVVCRNDKITLEEIKKLKPTHIVISPGPGRPDDPDYFGVCLSAIRELGTTTPLLGVCLGHQGIVYAFGGKVVPAPQIMHGKTSLIYHDGKNLFRGIRNPCEGMRYHSLVGAKAPWPKDLKITARTKDGVIMALQHKKYPIYGIQFHPESVGTPEGKRILKNFLNVKSKS
jgi:anthranilate synthase component 2